MTQMPFQFQTGAIKRELGALDPLLLCSFDSKLVRLKVVHDDIEDINRFRFDSKLVRLEA